MEIVRPCEEHRDHVWGCHRCVAYRDFLDRIEELKLELQRIKENLLSQLGAIADDLGRLF